MGDRGVDRNYQVQFLHHRGRGGEISQRPAQVIDALAHAEASDILASFAYLQAVKGKPFHIQQGFK